MGEVWTDRLGLRVGRGSVWQRARGYVPMACVRCPSQLRVPQRKGGVTKPPRAECVGAQKPSERKDLASTDSTVNVPSGGRLHARHDGRLVLGPNSHY